MSVWALTLIMTQKRSLDVQLPLWSVPSSHPVARGYAGATLLTCAHWPAGLREGSGEAGGACMLWKVKMWVRRGIWKPRRRKRREQWGGAGEGLLGLSLEEVSPIRLALGPGTDSSLCFGPPRGEESLGPRDIPAQSLHCPLLGTPPWVLDPWNSLPSRASPAS